MEKMRLIDVNWRLEQLRLAIEVRISNALRHDKFILGAEVQCPASEQCAESEFRIPVHAYLMPSEVDRAEGALLG